MAKYLLSLLLISLTASGSEPAVIFYDSPDPDERSEIARWQIAPDSKIVIDVEGNLEVVPIGFEGEPPPEPILPTISAFTVTPNEANPEDSVTLAWETENADSCAPGISSYLQSEWEVQSLPVGSTTVTIPSNATEGEKTFSLRCVNSEGPVSQSASLNVVVDSSPTDPENPEFCPSPDELAPSGFTRRTHIVCTSTTNCSEQADTGLHTTWTSVFGTEFPSSNKRSLYLPRNRYASLRFTTGASVGSGQLGAIHETFYDGSGKFGPFTASISECQADFRASLGRCRIRNDGSWSVSTTIKRWGTGFFDCQLEPNTTYYFNLMFYDIDNISSTPTCYGSMPRNCAGTFD